ncbi:MAG: S-methyl-5-thioribose-1-phosphate isomerase [Melioribacteraceae bacterium]|nr:S-methyl-5-thioribose-1-phosphate isomerase [Melioribacteraceae bacterium]
MEAETAFYVIKKAFDKGLVKSVYADETRPLLQGSRLTAFELAKAGIPFKINTDSTAAVLMSQGKIDLVITGADRISANGDSANKIGTYNLAVLCKFHKIPFYITAPTSTIDREMNSGDKIKIEERNKDEITKVAGVQITSDEYDVYSPAFDVTPNELITGIITEAALHKPPYNFK